MKTHVLFGILMPICFGRLAQLVRALPSHGRGRGFESPIAHQPRFSEVVFLGSDFLVPVFFLAAKNARGTKRLFSQSGTNRSDLFVPLLELRELQIKHEKCYNIDVL